MRRHPRNLTLRNLCIIVIMRLYRLTTILYGKKLFGLWNFVTKSMNPFASKNVFSSHKHVCHQLTKLAIIWPLSFKSGKISKTTIETTEFFFIKLRRERAKYLESFFNLNLKLYFFHNYSWVISKTRIYNACFGTYQQHLYLFQLRVRNWN